MKATLYARVSTNEQRKESIDDQLRECRELCRRHGFEVVAEFCDRGRSGNETNVGTRRCESSEPPCPSRLGGGECCWGLLLRPNAWVTLKPLRSSGRS